ncbi:glucose PTS transporter subunit IIA [Lactobacillus sp. ESL0731]|uniref:glucose PTS transporter subunit IIA n=1 Tax=unclassified Lactobacillus TaxID=2620435 RepID=UPI0023F8C895|nr:MULTISPECIES: glucose PTS transporter subunit IIA [unclassified Lactobacillus]WEV51473.1 glucose PTS transporter subunit IIA [Lactobacillus sp. ESL0700]WEV62602.1 glucose PTS transporter subunit IIA [Lactobacillus sp. ESL0731]
MDKHQLAQKIISLLGGNENINNYWHCVTRLRFTVNDDSKTNLSEIKKLKGVLGTELRNNQYQVVIGPGVDSLFSEVENILGQKESDNSNTTHKISGKIILDVISGVFQPILPALVAGGMLKGILAIILAIFPALDKNTTIALFNLIADVPFYFLPFLLAISSARKFKLNEFLGICMAGALLYPSFTAKISSGNSGLTLFGLKIPVFNYATSVFPVILGVGLMAIIYHFIDKFIPDVIKLVVVPALTLIIAVPIAMWILAPLGAYGGQYLASGIVWLFNKAGLLAGFLLGFFMPLIVLTGMHQSTSPIQIQNIATLGYDYLLPISFVHNLAESGAAFGMSLRMKDKEMKSAGMSTSFSAFLGISEPALYTVNVIHKNALLGAMFGSGIGGILTVLFGVKCFAFVMPGITSLPVYVKAGDGFTNAMLMIFCLIAAFVVSASVAYIFGREKKNEIKEHIEGTVELCSPVSGKLVSLNEVNDPVFSKEMMGKGFAVMPNSGEIYAPVSGTVSMIAETKHAIGITTDNGLEILVHMGIDTVESKNNPFTIYVEKSQRVKMGQEIALMDLKKIKDENKDPSIIVVITNSQNKIGSFDIAVTTSELNSNTKVASAKLI